MTQGAAGTEYVPRKGSSCDLALQQLRAHGRMGRDALAIAIDKEPDDLRALLAFPIRLGAIRSGLDADGKCWFEVGQRIVTLPPEPEKPAPVRPAVGKPVKVELDTLAGLSDEVLAQCDKDVQAVVANVRAAADQIPPRRDSQHVLKAEAATPDATDRETPATASPVGGPMGAGQPAAAGPAADQLDTATLARVRRERQTASSPVEKPEAITRLRIALWSDGFLVIMRGGQCIEFSKAEARQLVDYLDSISLDILREEA